MVLLLFTCHLSLSMGAKASCRAARKCCDGQDADCIVQDTPNPGSINSIMSDLAEEPCYCDHGCLEVGDCCPDFKDYCGGEFLFL